MRVLYNVLSRLDSRNRDRPTPMRQLQVDAARGKYQQNHNVSFLSSLLKHMAPITKWQIMSPYKPPCIIIRLPQCARCGWTRRAASCNHLLHAWSAMATEAYRRSYISPFQLWLIDLNIYCRWTRSTAIIIHILQIYDLRSLIQWSKSLRVTPVTHD